MKNVLEIKNVSKKLGKRKVLDDISLEIKEGEIFGFIGPNGAGKTTLIKVMLGLYKMDQGTVKIAGFDIKKDFESAMEEIGAIIENPEMYGYLSGKDNLDIYSRMEEDVSLSFKHELIRMVKLQDRINSKVKTYSLGMRQRLGIAQALLSNPKLLILDEPTNGLDPLGIKELRDMLKKLSREKNMAVFISSHILSEIELICDKIAIIDNGRIIEIKDLHAKKEEKQEVIFEVSDSLKSLEILEKLNYFGKMKAETIKLELGKEDIAKVNKYLVENNINIYGIKTNKRSLEDELLEKTKGTKGQIK